MRAVVILALFMLAPMSVEAAKKPCLCGPADQDSLPSVPTGGFCQRGSPTIITGTGPWDWHCTAPSCVTVSCEAQLIGAPFLMMSFVPPAGQVESTAGTGTAVATVVVTWSDGKPFTGTLGFGPPYADASGAFALSGNRLVVGSEAALRADVGQTVFVTVEAVE